MITRLAVHVWIAFVMFFTAEAAAGLPHGTIQLTTAGEIRAAGGTVELVPEAAYPGGPLNTWHVSITAVVNPASPAHKTLFGIRTKMNA